MAVTYEHFYFELDGLARVSRLLLDLSGAKWTDRYVKDWATEKQTTPFLRVPVLTEFNDDGSKFVMAESLSICRYLASQHGWFGCNPHETAHIDMYCESWSEIYQKYIPLIGNGMYKWNKWLSQEAIDKELSDLRENVIIPILTKHEEALAKNGTGYYVGDKMTLADMLAAVSLPLLNYKEAVTKATHPHLFALCDKLNATETFQAQKKRFAKE